MCAVVAFTQVSRLKMSIPGSLDGICVPFYCSVAVLCDSKATHDGSSELKDPPFKGEKVADSAIIVQNPAGVPEQHSYSLLCNKRTT